MTTVGSAPTPLRQFILAFSELIAQAPDEPCVLREGARLLETLIACDDWLPDAFAQPAGHGYGQHLLHCDSQERFCVVSFAWGPGQGTPVHDHTIWGLVGMLRGGEVSQAYDLGDAGLRRRGAPRRLQPGEVEAVSPAIGDIHQVWNAYADQPSVSIHVYGADIGRVRRSTYAPSGQATPFISGYCNTLLPNLGDADPTVET